jgi:LacI family transcriptional regulator
MSTIRDVAKIAGVSTATVSRVINSPEAVSPGTRDRVAKAMKACRYQYNALARGFVTQQSYTLGLIVPSITNPTFAESIRGVQDFAHREGYQVLLGNSDYENAKEARLCEVLRERQIEGLIITTTDLKGKVLRDLLDDHFPFVLLYSTVRKGPISAVGVDNFRGGYSATEHLIQLGHRRIAMLAGGFSFSDKSLHRWHGYKKCLRDHRIPYDPALVLQTQYALENGREGIKALLALDPPPTAVFCSNDFMAIGAMQGAREFGVATPAELSIVGFDDMAIASYISPGLTTIRQPAYEMGRMGTEILLDCIKKRAGGPVHKILETSIVIRESSGPPARKQKTPTERRSP